MITPKIPLRFKTDGSYKICCFSDLHETADYDPRSYAALDGIIEREQPDLVLLGGDIWNGALDRPIEELKAFWDAAETMEPAGKTYDEIAQQLM